MAGLWLWTRTDWRNRWGSLVGVTLLIALAGGTTLAVATGARRAATAVERYYDTTNWPNVEVQVRAPETLEEFGSIPYPSPSELADRVASVDGVLGVTAISWIAASPDPDGFFFNFAFGATRGSAPTPPIVRGRAPDPAAADEAIVNEAGLEAWGVDVGDTMTVSTLAPGQWDQFIGLVPYAPEGPAIRLRVVGVQRDLEAVTDRPEPVFGTTRAFVERWADEVIVVTGSALVNADRRHTATVVTEAQRLVGPAYEVAPVTEDFVARIADPIDVEVTALVAFAVTAGAAGAVVVGQALARHLGRGVPEYRIRTAMGVVPRQQVLGSILAVAPAIVAGVGSSVVLAIAASPLLPRGIARTADLHAGLFVDHAVLGFGAAAITAILVAITAGTTLGILRRLRQPPSAPARVSRAVRLFGALPAVPGLGARLAVGHQRATAAPWAGVAAVTVGVAGAIAVSTIDRSVENLLATPSLYGAPWDLDTLNQPIAERLPLEALAGDPDVAMVAAMVNPVSAESVDNVSRVVGPGGSAVVEPYTFEVASGPVPLVIVDGRPPGPGEAAVGADVLADLGAALGDRLTIEGPRGDVHVTVVGRSVNAGTDELGLGFYLPPDTFAQLVPSCDATATAPRCGTQMIGTVVQLRQGAERDAAVARLREIVPELQPTSRPSVIGNLTEIGSTPTWLGGFLALLGFAGLTHALVVGTRHARRDLAVTRALGMRPREAAAVVRWAAAILAVLGSLLGVVVGVVVGRIIWQRVVDGVGALLAIDLPSLAIAIAPAVAITTAFAVALVPAHRAARMRPGSVLRAE